MLKKKGTVLFLKERFTVGNGFIIIVLIFL